MLEYFKTRRAASTILLVAVFFALGVYIGFNNRPDENKIVNLSGKEIPTEISNTNVDFSPFWKAWNSIDEKYPNAKDVGAQDRVYGAISGLIASLNDPYSVFFNPNEAKLFEEDLQGNFSGVGMEIGMKEKILTVIAPLKDTPAYKAGIKSGDKILKIDDKVTSGMSVEKAIGFIRGEKGTVVTLTIFRDGEKDPRVIKVTRDIINTPVINTELRKDGVFIIRLYSFSANSSELFKNALKEFVDSKSDKLIFDLRGNPGGYLDAAVNMASWFLPSGKTVVTEDYGNSLKPKIYRSSGYNIFNENLKFVILIDGGSASASEIFSGAMQDYKKAILVGSKSFGKGSVQEVDKITPSTLLKITVANWLTPNGNWITNKGLTPDYLIEYTRKDAETSRDPQLEKAIELLNNWQKKQ